MGTSNPPFDLNGIHIKHGPIEAAIVELIKYRPFYGNMVLNMKTHFDKRVPLAGVNVTDRVNLFINPDIFLLLNKAEQTAVLEHEVNHLVNEHITRRGNRRHDVFNMACDIAINQFIQNLPTKEKLIEAYCKAYKDAKKEELEKVICGCLLPETYKLPKNLTAEEYYELLMENDKVKKMIENQQEVEISMCGQECQQNGGMCPHQNDKPNQGCSGKIKICKGSMDDHGKWEEKTGGSSLNDEMVKEKIKQLVRKVQNSMAAGDIPAHLKQVLEELFRTSTKWKQALSRFLTRATLPFQTSSRKKMNRRYGLIFPGTKVEHKLKIGVAIDESGSISDELCQLFFSELDRLNLISPEIHIIHFDCTVSCVEKYKKYKPKERKSCGGTDFVPPIKEAEKMQLDALVILTDGYADTNIKKPKLPVLWALEGDEHDKFEHPFGSKIKLEPDKNVSA